MAPVLSIIIPTRNRIDLLIQAIGLLLDEMTHIEQEIEILVVDDGSDKPLMSDLSAAVQQHTCADRVRYLNQDHKGPAAARNLGIREAGGDIVLFTGDDILARPGLLHAHIKAHTEIYPDEHFAILGIADLAPELVKTPFTRWWRKWNFRYDQLESGKRQPDYSFFYTNNLSLKRRFILEHGFFDEDFKDAAYEDGELGYRLGKQGLELAFEPKAAADHYHKMDLETACRRMVTRGKAYDMFIEKTGMFGMSQIWMAIGTGPWMRPIFIRPLFQIAKWLESRATVGVLYILVLMYFFQVGRGKCAKIL